MAFSSSSFRRRWLVPITVLTALAQVLFWGLYAFDHLSHDAVGGPTFLRYLDFDPNNISDAVSALAGMNAAVFGIVITVVSIIVQLSADRYTGVARMFFGDRVNLGVAAYYVVACVVGVWLSVTLKHDYVPHWTLLAMIIATTGSLVLMGPYFSYVFRFLEPMSIIGRIRDQAVTTAHRGSRQERPDAVSAAQAEALAAMEELTDITSNSISGKDKIIASGAVDALKDFTIRYVREKSKATPPWFRIGPGIEENPDFVAMDPESLADLVERRTWVEWKVLRQYLGIYNEALAVMRDINYLIAIDTRYIAEAAGELRDAELLELCVRFMNSYLRATLNARDVRTAYNVLNQYRLLVEAMLRQGNSRAAREGVRHMAYYGHVSFDMKLTFVTETIAYDLSALCQIANELGSEEEDAMLEQFLELDRPLRVSAQESALLGVRKAQVKLAAFYLMRGLEEKARMISRDMDHEPPERLRSIRQALERVTTKDFWEIIDRGRNFEYMPPAQRACLSTFFGWLDVAGD
ncbi:MAG TPA: DUF2254 family protein [Polyangiaceae bacterium]|jgi:hypothetical protein|nr:DUF2254 family protein [Polyangiaceae bacterium]